MPVGQVDDGEIGWGDVSGKFFPVLLEPGVDNVCKLSVIWGRGGWWVWEI